MNPELKARTSQPSRARAVVCAAFCAVFAANVLVPTGQESWRGHFGGKSVFLTQQTSFLLALYTACVLLGATFKDLAPLCALADRFTGRPLFAIGWLVCLAYYALIHWDPVMKFAAGEDRLFWEKMHMMHAVPAVFVTLNALELKNVPASYSRELTVLYAYGAFYLVWSAFCAHMGGGLWPYPFQKEFALLHHVVFDAVIFVIVGLLYLAARLVSSCGLRSRPETRPASA